MNLRDLLENLFAFAFPVSLGSGRFVPKTRTVPLIDFSAATKCRLHNPCNNSQEHLIPN